MKKLKNILLVVFALMLVVLPIALTGCGDVETSLEIFRDFQYEYYYGEELNLEGGILKYTETGKEPEYILMTNDEVEVKYFDNTIIGTNKLVVEYKEKTLEIEYTISAIIDITNGWYYQYDEEYGYSFIKFEDGVIYSAYVEEGLSSLEEVTQLITSGQLEHSMIMECEKQMIEGKYIYTCILGEDEYQLLHTLTPHENGKSFGLEVMQMGTSMTANYILLEI